MDLSCDSPRLALLNPTQQRILGIIAEACLVKDGGGLQATNSELAGYLGKTSSQVGKDIAVLRKLGLIKTRQTSLGLGGGTVVNTYFIELGKC